MQSILLSDRGRHRRAPDHKVIHSGARTLQSALAAAFAHRRLLRKPHSNGPKTLSSRDRHGKVLSLSQTRRWRHHTSSDGHRPAPTRDAPLSIAHPAPGFSGIDLSIHRIGRQSKAALPRWYLAAATMGRVARHD